MRVSDCSITIQSRRERDERGNGSKTYSVRRVSEHLERFNSIRLERAVEHKEARKLEVALDLGSVKVINLHGVMKEWKRGRAKAEGRNQTWFS